MSRETITLTLDVQDARIHRDALSRYLVEVVKTTKTTNTTNTTNTKSAIRNAALEHLHKGVRVNLDAINEAIFALADSSTDSSTVPYAEDMRRAEEAASRAFGPRLKDGEKPLDDEPTAYEQGREDF
jgi:hypothetical protein